MTSLIPVYTELGTRNVPEILYETKTSLFCQKHLHLRLLTQIFKSNKFIMYQNSYERTLR